MPFWARKPAILAELMRGGKLSDFGGPQAAVEYRVWVTTQDGKKTYFADPEFVGAYLSWKRTQSDLDYYADIELPVAVVWDQGLGQYREVIPDTLVPLVELEHPSAARRQMVQEKKEERKEKEAARARTEEEKELERIHAELDKKLKVKKPKGETPPDLPGGQVLGNPRRRRPNPSALPRYQGWANQPSWAVWLWVSSDEGIARVLNKRRRRLTAREAREFVELYFPDGVPDFRDKGGRGLYAVVDWREIAGALNEMIGQENPLRNEKKTLVRKLSVTEVVIAGTLVIGAVVLIINAQRSAPS